MAIRSIFSQQQIYICYIYVSYIYEKEKIKNKHATQFKELWNFLLEMIISLHKERQSYSAPTCVSGVPGPSKNKILQLQWQGCRQKWSPSKFLEELSPQQPKAIVQEKVLCLLAAICRFKYSIRAKPALPCTALTSVLFVPTNSMCQQVYFLVGQVGGNNEWLVFAWDEI